MGTRTAFNYRPFLMGVLEATEAIRSLHCFCSNTRRIVREEILSVIFHERAAIDEAMNKVEKLMEDYAFIAEVADWRIDFHFHRELQDLPDWFVGVLEDKQRHIIEGMKGQRFNVDRASDEITNLMKQYSALMGVQEKTRRSAGYGRYEGCSGEVKMAQQVIEEMQEKQAANSAAIDKASDEVTKLMKERQVAMDKARDEVTKLMKEKKEYSALKIEQIIKEMKEKQAAIDKASDEVTKLMLERQPAMDKVRKVVDELVHQHFDEHDSGNSQEFLRILILRIQEAEEAAATELRQKQQKDADGDDGFWD